MIYVFMYLSAIVLANLSIAAFGPGVSVINAFLFIGLDLTARDKLHEVWHGNGLVWKMAILIATGSTLSWLLNRGAAQIALASFAAFAAAAIIDTAVYHRLLSFPRWIKMNGSNIPASAVDSFVFPLIAFGWPPLLIIMAGQFIAKVAGGLLWSIIIFSIAERHITPKVK